MSQFRNLVFEGGGVKGIAYAGALEVLEQKQVLNDIRRTAGTSAGAITAALLAMGADSRSIGEIVGSTDFRRFMDDSYGVLRDARRLWSRFGWFKGDAFANWMKRQVYALTDHSDLTFADLRQRAAEQPATYRELFVIGTNLSAQIPEVFSADTTPNVPIWLAVRISMSIPLFFAAIRRQGQVNVDGGISWNYPLDLFDDRKYVSVAEHGRAVDYPTTYGPDHVYNQETLGLRVDTKDEIAAELKGLQRPPREINNLADYLGVFLGFMLDTLNKAHLHENDWHRTVFIDALGVGTTEFGLSDERVAALVESGRAGALAYFEWFEKEDSQPLNRA